MNHSFKVRDFNPPTHPLMAPPVSTHISSLCVCTAELAVHTVYVIYNIPKPCSDYTLSVSPLWIYSTNNKRINSFINKSSGCQPSFSLHIPSIPFCPKHVGFAVVPTHSLQHVHFSLSSHDQHTIKPFFIHHHCATHIFIFLSIVCPYFFFHLC